nr:hypothetical protein [Tanacetum cinerariifolium]
MIQISAWKNTSSLKLKKLVGMGRRLIGKLLRTVRSVIVKISITSKILKQISQPSSMRTHWKLTTKSRPNLRSIVDDVDTETHELDEDFQTDHDIHRESFNMEDYFTMIKVVIQMQCSYSCMVWAKVLNLADLPSISPKWVDVMGWLLPLSKRNTIASIVGRLIVAASSYFIWSKISNVISNGIDDGGS